MGIFANDWINNRFACGLKHSIGILGGTFDPVHYGHLRVALECKESLGLDELRMLPCARPPHRDQPIATAEQRLAMLELALQDSDHILADERELTRSGLSYMIDTLKSFKADFPQAVLFLIVGSDSFQSLPTWHNWEKILDFANIVIAKRPDSKDDRLSETGRLLSGCFVNERDKFRQMPNGVIFELQVSQLDISSTGIRKLVQQKKSPQYLLPKAVINYIKNHSLYL